MMSNNSSAPTKIITIVGGGFCGALTGVNILRQNPEGNIRIILIDRGTRLGRGLAYGTWDDNFLLNVPAGNMSAFPDDPNHFVRFCQDVDPAFNSATFASRRLYGDYLELTLRQASERNAGIMLEKVRGEAIAIRRQQGDDSYRIDLASGRSIQSGQVVLALGHFPPSNPVAFTGLHETGIYIANPWDFVALERANGEGPIAILGMGLTALDTLFRLTSSSDTRKIYLVSRHGLFPQSHRFNPKPPAPAGFPSFLENLPSTVRAYVHAVRLEIRKNADSRRRLARHYQPLASLYPAHMATITSGRAEEVSFSRGRLLGYTPPSARASCASTPEEHARFGSGGSSRRPDPGI